MIYLLFCWPFAIISKLKNSAFEEASVFRNEELVQLIHSSLIGIRSFSIEIDWKEAKQMVL